MNQSFCNGCSTLVPAERLERDGCVYLVKNCPTCGATETLISGDARRYFEKQRLDRPFHYLGCGLKCDKCPHEKKPNMVFIDITNRCNLNCPICINNTPSMGFLFEPPMEYFEKIFKHFSTQSPRPAIQLFGGEPTVRKDLLEMIAMARAYGLPTRVVTNGIALANEEFCRKLVASRATILIAYDNDNPELYRNLRGSEKALDLKLKAIENIRKCGGAKVVLMSLVANEYNAKDLPKLFEFCHERREFIRGIYLMPLAHVWKDEQFESEPDRITSEDVEGLVEQAFLGDKVDFIPAGLLGSLKNLLRNLHIKPLPFAGAHPNCESMYLLISDGERYRPLGHYLKRGMVPTAQRLLEMDGQIGALEKKLQTGAFGRFLGGLRLRTTYLRMRVLWTAFIELLRTIRIGRLLKGRGPAKVYHALAAGCGLMFGRHTRTVLARHTRMESSLQLIVLPFEDHATLETHRLERCPAVFAYWDKEAGAVRMVTTCAWGVHKTAVMRRINEQYQTQA